MIDTDKYEGHTPVRKKWPRWCEDWLFKVYADDGSHIPNWNQDNNLACDAPLLLAEVKRLRKKNEEFGYQLIEAIGLLKRSVRVTKDGRRHYAERFERQTNAMLGREMIE